MDDSRMFFMSNFNSEFLLSEKTIQTKELKPFVENDSTAP